jgi:hypothetical protein
MRSLLVLLALFSCLAAAKASESPRMFAHRFYAAHQAWAIRGVPEARHEGIVSQYMCINIIRAFRRVNEHRELEAKFSDSKSLMKPRWCSEGDVFCDNWEGITHYAVGNARVAEGRWIVEAHLEYIEDGKLHA